MRTRNWATGISCSLAILAAGCAAETGTATTTPAKSSAAAQPAIPKSEMMPNGFHTLGAAFLNKDGAMIVTETEATPSPRDQRIADAFFKLPPIDDPRHPIVTVAACGGAGDDALRPYTPFEPADPAEALSAGIRCAVSYNPGTRWDIVNLITDDKRYIAWFTLFHENGSETRAYVDVTVFADSVAR